MTALPIEYSRLIANADHDEARRLAEFATRQALINGKMAEDLITLIGKASELILCGRTYDALHVLEEIKNAAAEVKEARRHG